MFPKTNKRFAFTLLDSIVGALIISSSLILYFDVTQQLNHKLINNREQLVESRIKYEKNLFE